MGRSHPEVVHDIKPSYAWNTRSGNSGQFSSSTKNTKKMSLGSLKQLESEGDEMDIKRILKDVKYLSSSSMSWKERKKLEDQNVVRLGGKPPKKHRVPLSVAKVPMKRQKQREKKKLEEEMILGKFVKRSTADKREKRKPEDRVLKTSEGQFRNGVLDVKHMLNRRPPRESDSMSGPSFSEGKKKGKGKARGKSGKNKGNKRRH